MVNPGGILPDRVANIISLLVTVTFVLDIRLPNKWVRAASSGFVEERGWCLSPRGTRMPPPGGRNQNVSINGRPVRTVEIGPQRSVG